eukprot:Rmarinus@m.24274
MDEQDSTLLPITIVVAFTGVLWYATYHTKLSKVVSRYSSGESELQRACRLEDVDRMVHSFRQSLFDSSQLADVRHLLLTPGSDFDETAACARIAEVKNMRGPKMDIVLANMRACLRDLHGVTLLVDHLSELAGSPIDYDEHFPMLDEVWSTVRPGVPRGGDGRVTRDWIDIGFQGEDPATDFRATGTLGLLVLCEFARAHPDAARRFVERGLERPLQALPLALTVINFTADVLQLVRERHLDVDLAVLASTASGPVPDTEAAADALDLFEKSLHPEAFVTLRDMKVDRFYALVVKVLLRFERRWEEENPPTIMAFEQLKIQFLEEVQNSLQRAGKILDE